MTSRTLEATLTVSAKVSDTLECVTHANLKGLNEVLWIRTTSLGQKGLNVVQRILELPVQKSKVTALTNFHFLDKEFSSL